MYRRNGMEEDQQERDGENNVAPLLSVPYRYMSTGSLELYGIHEERPSTVLEFESLHRKPEENLTCMETLKEYASRKWKKFSLKRTLSENFPTLSTLKQYKVREYLPNDVVAGLTAGITMIPQGMAFASLSTLPPIVGLYICLFASVTYFVLGTSHQLSWGCVAVLSILTGNILDSYEAKVKADFAAFQSNPELVTSTVVPLLNFSHSSFIETVSTNSTVTPTAEPLLAALSTEKKIEVAGAVTLMSGVILALLGKLGLGRLTTFMSDGLVTSFTVGVSFHVVSSQIKAALDVNIPRRSGVFKLIYLWIDLISNIQHANPATVIISVICVIILYVVKRFINEKYKSKLRVPIPIELFVVIIATIVTAYSGLSEKYSVSIVEEVPIGVPSPRIPDLSLGTDYITEGLVIIIVSFTQNVAMAKLMGLKHNYRINCNQEMFACGMVSVVCSVFSGYISGPSVSRSMVQDGAGGKTQVASLFAAALVFLVIMLIGPYFYYLPKCVLAAIIIVNLRSMFLKMTAVPTLWRQSRVDGIVWVITCVGTVVLGTDLGLLVGIIVCILLVLMRSQVNTVDVMSEIHAGNVHVWRSQDRYLGGKRLCEVQVVRINSALYFANAEIMTDQVFKKTGINPLKMKKAKNIDIKVNVDREVQKQNVESEGKQLTISSQVGNGKSLGNDTKESIEPDVQSDFNSTNRVPETKSLIVDLSSVPFVDVMGVQALEFLIVKYQAVGITVYFANVQEKCLDTLHKMGFLIKHRKNVFISIEAAVEHIGFQT